MKDQAFKMLTPLGQLAPLAGVAVVTTMSLESDGYRIGFKDAEGKVPLFGDYRFLAWAGGAAYAALAPFNWPGRDLAAYSSGVAFSSLFITEWVRASETKNLWGWDLPSLANVPVAGKLFAPKEDAMADLDAVPAEAPLEKL